ncbi:uncharacterized protein LOC128252060 [Drosophila gunungcola]|uniref:Uncharacterized protein n=1 Tax=Drosophila gunungcola TaxID=103775 RepID=A0A9Q0BW29_9MUSC|nr:uncharacterized protein LOC128252060 [Drosophila gunungcola]KAI8046356.1 hypothetical protein M5D96_002558 [Drosophila gunungcola]
MASRFIVFFSAIIVLAQGSNVLPIEQEAEVAVHYSVVSSGAPVVVVSQGHPSVHQPQRPIYSHGPVSVPLGGPHRVIGSGLAGPRSYVAAPLRPAPVSYVRPATVVIPAPRVVVGPAVPIRHPHGVAAPIIVGSGHGNVHQIRHHGQKPY